MVYRFQYGLVLLAIIGVFISTTACGQTTNLWTNGVSNAGSGNWQDANAWNGLTWTDAGVPPHNIARFSATNASYTVTNNGTVIVGGLDFVKGPATLRGGTIQFGNNVTNKNNSFQEAKIYSVLSADPGVDVTFGPGNQNWSIYTNANIPGKIIIDLGNTSYQLFLQTDNVFTNTGDNIILQRAKLDCRSASSQNLTNRTFVLGGGTIWVNTGTLDLGDVRFDSLYTAGGTLSGNNKQINIRGRLIGNATNAVLSVSGANVDLYNPNVYTGGLALSIAAAYSVTLRATNALPLNTVVTNNGYLRLGTGSVSVVQELAGLAGTNGLVIGNASSVSTLVINNTTNYTYTGRLGGGSTVSNNLALIKTGAGRLTLSGTNTYNGGTIISNGYIVVGSSLALGTNQVTMAGGSMSSTGGTWTVSNVINLASSVLIDTSTNALTLSGAITNGGSIYKTGTGTLVLSGTNTYSGSTVISNGVLSLTHQLCLSTNTDVYIYTGATNDLNFTGTNAINKLYTNGVLLVGGVYNSANLPSFLTGGGSLMPVPPSEGSVYCFY